MSAPQLPSIDGILCVDKPKDWTSHDVCAFIRSRFKIKKVGHAGTLDPLATGLLVVLLGRATKQSIALTSNDKEYSGVMELGVKTDSHDRKGAELATAPAEKITLEDIKNKTAEKFTGDIIQVPPMVSALKQKGVRLYELARKGIEVPREGRPVTVHDWKITRKEGNFVEFSTRVSKGTYVRTLVNDLGEALGCFACLADLRRLRSGDYKIEDSLTIDQLKSLTAPELRQKIVASRFTAHARLQGD